MIRCDISDSQVGDLDLELVESSVGCCPLRECDIMKN